MISQTEVIACEDGYWQLRVLNGRFEDQIATLPEGSSPWLQFGEVISVLLLQSEGELVAFLSDEGVLR